MHLSQWREFQSFSKGLFHIVVPLPIGLGPSSPGQHPYSQDMSVNRHWRHCSRVFHRGPKGKPQLGHILTE